MSGADPETQEQIKARVAELQGGAA